MLIPLTSLKSPAIHPALRERAAMIALESLMAVFYLRRSVSLPELAGVLAVAFPLYVHHFWWHFALGQKSGTYEWPIPQSASAITTKSNSSMSFVCYSLIRVYDISGLLVAADGDAFMPIEFQRTIWNNSNYDPSAPKPPFFDTFFYVSSQSASLMNGSIILFLRSDVI